MGWILNRPESHEKILARGSDINGITSHAPERPASLADDVRGAHLKYDPVSRVIAFVFLPILSVLFQSTPLLASPPDAAIVTVRAGLRTG